MLFAIGKTVSGIHGYLAGCKQKYKRFSYDQHLLPSISEGMTFATMSDVITGPQAQVIYRAIAKIKRRLEEPDQTDSQRHIVHSDIYKSNIIQNNGIITPIGFSLCGYSHFYLDIAALFSNFKNDGDRRNLIKGYQSVRKPEIDPYFIEPYFTLESMLFFACQYERAQERDWWDEVVENACEQGFKPLAAKRPFLSI